MTLYTVGIYATTRYSRMMSEQENVDTSFLIGNKRAERGLVLAKTPNAVRKIERIAPNMWQIWKVDSSSVKDVVYTVVEKSNGELECDCADFTNRPNMLLCKHIFACMYMEAFVQ